MLKHLIGIDIYGLWYTKRNVYLCYAHLYIYIDMYPNTSITAIGYSLSYENLLHVYHGSNHHARYILDFWESSLYKENVLPV